MPYKDRGRWRTDIRINGKRLPSISFKTKREAKEWEEEQRRLSKKDCHAMALSELVVKYLDYSELQFMNETYKLKKRIFTRLLGGINGNIRVTQMTRAMMTEYLIDQANDRSPSKANEDLKHIKAMFNWALRTYDIQYNPVAGIEKFKADKKELYTPPESDVIKMITTATGEGKVFLDCYLFTGAREQEVNRMRWKDIDFEQGRLCLWSRKTKSRILEPQWIDLAPQLAESLLWWKEHRPYESDHVFVNNQKGNKCRGNPYTNRNKLLEQLCKQAGVKKFGFHCMRRYVGSILAKKGVPMKTIQGILRHKSLAYTENYVRGLGVDMSEAIETLQANLAPKQTSPKPEPLRLVKSSAG